MLLHKCSNSKWRSGNKINPSICYFSCITVFSETWSAISALPDIIKTDNVFPISKMFHGLCLRSENVINDVKYPRTASVSQKQMLHIFETLTFEICLVDSGDHDGFSVKINPLHCQTAKRKKKNHLWFSCEQGEQGALTQQEFGVAKHDTGSCLRLYEQNKALHLSKDYWINRITWLKIS